jgi:hypothetical protein
MQTLNNYKNHQNEAVIFKLFVCFAKHCNFKRTGAQG